MPKTKPKPKPRPPKTVAAWQAALDLELGRLLALMEHEWGEAPKLKASASPCVIVDSDFAMKGFAHKGGRTYARVGVARPVTPRAVAHKIVAELLSHRDRCNECGVPRPSLRERVWFFEGLLGLEARHYNSLGWVYDGPVGRNGRRQGREATADDAPHFAVPADAVERVVFARWAGKLDKLLAEHDALARTPKPEPDVWPVGLKEIARRIKAATGIAVVAEPVDLDWEVVDDEIKVTDRVYVQVGSLKEYLIVNLWEGDLCRNWPIRTSVAVMLQDLKEALEQEAQNAGA